MTHGKNRVFIGGITAGVSKDSIEREFEKFGKLTSVWIAQNPPGFAFVEFDSGRDAEEAVTSLNGATLFDGLKVRVEHSKERTGGGGGRGGPRGGFRSGGGDRGNGDRPNYGGGRSMGDRDRGYQGGGGAGGGGGPDRGSRGGSDRGDRPYDRDRTNGRYSNGDGGASNGRYSDRGSRGGGDRAPMRSSRGGDGYRARSPLNAGGRRSHRDASPY